MLIPFAAVVMVLLMAMCIFLVVGRIAGKRDLRKDIADKKRREGEL
ncbi:MAG TPA: hypothetical protein VHC47_15205 [Mucilaginibacter sp.]|nr:hypothetical protein [Mucilaginibacter sp.]